MKQVSAEYKNQIKEMGREIDSIITYYNHYQIITENNKYILTEDGQKLLTEQIKQDSNINITAEDIYSCKVITHGDLLKTMMKEFDFEVKQDIKIGSLVSYKFGLKVNDSYEYVDYGMFIVNKKEYNEDTQTYSYVAYDKMLFTMIPYVAEDISERQGAYTLYDLVNYCCEFCNLQLGVETFPNGEREITDDILKSLESSNFTFRDILDYATEVTGCSSYMIDDSFIISPPNETNLVLYADSFKDTNVKFNEVFGPVNSILFSRSEDTDVIEIKDDDSIQANGVTQIKIKDNPFLEGNDRADYFEEMFDVLNGLTYSLNDVSSTGITYLEFNDKYKVNIDENEYDCLLLNDEIIVEQGLEENIFTEMPQEKQQEYVTSRLDDRGQKWANIQVKKDLGEISLEVGQKVDNDNIISAINLSPEQATIQAQKVNLQGYVTATDLAGTGTTTINGSNITTGTINADLIKSGQIVMQGYSQGNPFINLGDLTHDRYPYGIEIWDNCILVTDYRDGGLSYIRTSNGDGYAELSGAVCNAFAFNNISLEEKKKNFEKFTNALDIVKSTDIYKYNYNFEKDNYKKHIGIVIGDKYNYSKEITTNKNDSVDTYAMISVLWQAVKEQQKEIEELKERIGK